MAQRIAVEATVACLPALRDVAARVARSAGAPEAVVGGIALAVDEATTNVILHGYRQRPGTIELTAEIVGDEIVVVIADRAPLYDPLTAPEPDLQTPVERRQAGGFGVHLIRRNVDSFEHSAREGGGNVLVLRRRLADAPARGAGA